MSNIVNQSNRCKSNYYSYSGQEEQPELYPVRKAKVADNGNVYFIPVSGFPLPEAERKKVKRFLDELRKCYAQLAETSLSNCLGILNKVLEFKVLEKVGLNLFDWRPQTAIALFPDQSSPHIPAREEAMSWKEGFPVHEVMPMITYILKKEAVDNAYEELFGCGGTILYASTIEGQKLFAKTKEVFGYRITDQCFQIMNCLPVLGINALLEATDNQFRALYSAIGLYLAESMQDEGVVIVADRSLDREIAEMVHLLPDQRRK